MFTFSGDLVVSILIEWLTIEDLARFDSAVCQLALTF